MRTLLTMLVTALVLAAGLAVHGVETNHAPANVSATVLLQSGEKLTGFVLNTAFTWRTPYARIALTGDQVSEMDLAPAPGANQRLTTVRGDRLSGLLEDDVLFLHPGGSVSDTRLPRETISSVTFRTGAPSAAVPPSAMVFRFRNGDKVNGWLTDDRLILTTATNGAAAENSLAVSNIVAIDFLPGQECVVTLRDQREVHGKVASDQLALQCVAGPLIEVHPASILTVRSKAALELQAASLTRTNFTGSCGIQLVWIPPGQFQMGSPPEEPGRDPDEGPVTTVHLTNGFWIGKYEITQAQFQNLMGVNPSSAAGTNLPVEKVTWHEAMDFCRRLNSAAETHGNLPEGFVYRLPTEAEWEYACRAGTQRRFSHDDDADGTALERFAWFTRNSESTPHPVGTRQANPWGLHDMHGNVWEWCLDRWEGSLPGVTVTNYPVTPPGNLRVARGGSWLYDLKGCRAANRDDYSFWNRCADIGFRVVLAPAKQ